MPILTILQMNNMLNRLKFLPFRHYLCTPIVLSAKQSVMKADPQNALSLIPSDPQDKTAEIYDAYTKITSIIKRTHIAMGRSKVKRYSFLSATSSEKIIINGTSTH